MRGLYETRIIETEINSPSRLQEAIRIGLESNFSDVKVWTSSGVRTDQEPFHLSVPYISGQRTVAVDVGSVSYLLPQPDRSKKYSLAEVKACCGLNKDAVAIGACAGPFWKIGDNSEMMVDGFKSHIGYLSPTNEPNAINNFCNQDFGILGNFLLSDCDPEGEVIRVQARCRTGHINFTDTIRRAIIAEYPDTIISLGGVFSLTGSTSRCHVMSKFATDPLNSPDKVAKWLRMFEFPSPMSFTTVIHCHDPGMQLRALHTHGISHDGKVCGHYHCDLVPQNAEYDAVFAVASHIARIDEPAIED